MLPLIHLTLLRSHPSPSERDEYEPAPIQQMSDEEIERAVGNMVLNALPAAVGLVVGLSVLGWLVRRRR